MRKILIYNYWLIIVAWCMFLNDLTLLAVILGLLACLMLVLIKRKINYWRMSFISLISYVIISLILLRTNVPYFFPKLYIFLAIICLNLAFTFERMYIIKSNYLKPFFAVMLVSVIVLSLITLLLPNSLYTIFTKNSLFIMISIIFLPSLVSVAFCICYKDIKNGEKYQKLVKAIAIPSQRI